MIKRLLPLFAALCLLACQGKPAQNWPAPSPALWEVRGADDTVKGWLFGTVHALPDGVEWRTPLLDHVVKEADLLVVEVTNLDDKAAANASFMRFAKASGLPPLMDRVPQKDRPALTRLMRDADARQGDFVPYDSWAAALMLANAAQSGKEPENGVDRWLLKRNIKTVGLEGFEQQFRIFDQLSQSQQVALLMGVAEETQDSESDGNLRAWLTGDVDALKAETSKGILADPALRQTLLIDRNERWAGVIDGWLKKDHAVLVAVGAAHMLGDKGLPALLRQRGYSVNRIQ
ncbi:TraB/GumN family protein [Altererythrobacter indicus]|uniref:TraB/GumN family protein n=1 Tax=Altericroceibacterium indicum TaxID=374177 RepID=A0A845A7B4_9SPHN|nr:TraB/GumN family protein [Altericroceibacterium indicum]MXP25239.1 TraB/GumN family protein [Altericroceibacterium indicum]